MGSYATGGGVFSSQSTPSVPYPRSGDLGSGSGCGPFWDRVGYKIYRAINSAAFGGTAGGGSFNVDTERIKPGYYWLVLHAAAHVEINSQTFIGWFLCPDTDGDRAVQPAQSNGAPQRTGIGLTQPGVPMSNQVGVVSFLPMECPKTPLIIPQGFFLRALTFAANNTPAFGTVLEMRLSYIELPIGDVGPLTVL